LPRAASFRRAVRDDLDGIVRMLADDALGARRETPSSPLPPSYHAAFDAIDSDPNNELVVGELDGRAVAVLQLTFIPNISGRASAAAAWSSSPPTSRAPTPSASTSRSASSLRTRA
jgi:hypothetical protein